MMNKRALTIIEYVFLIVFVLTAILVFRSYILRGVAGRYKNVGDSYGFGRQYDTHRTMACGFDDRLNIWYDEACFDNLRLKCAPGDDACETDVIAKECAKNQRGCEEPAGNRVITGNTVKLP